MTKLSQSLLKNTKQTAGSNSMFKVFDEKPSDSRITKRVQGDERICAHDLFSMFTADIIKKKTVFVR